MIPDAIVKNFVSSIKGTDDPHSSVPLYMDRVTVQTLNNTTPPTVDVVLNGTVIHNVKYVGLPVAGNFAQAIVVGVEASSDIIILCNDLGASSITGDLIETLPYNKVKSGAAPTASPTPTLKNGVGFIYTKWDAAPGTTDIVTYEVHLSTFIGFTPTGATKITEVTDLFTMIRTLPGTNTLLSAGTTYYVRLVAKSNSGTAAAGSQSLIAFREVTGPDIEAGSVTALDAIFATAAIVDADIQTLNASKITAGTITANIEIIAPTIRTANASTVPRIEIVHGTTDQILFFTGAAGETSPGFIQTNNSSGAGFIKYASQTAGGSQSFMLLDPTQVSLAPDGSQNLLMTTASTQFFNAPVDFGSVALTGDLGGHAPHISDRDGAHTHSFHLVSGEIHWFVDATDLGAITFH